MPVSKAYLRRLTRVIRDRVKRAAVRKFLVKHAEEINTNKLVITPEGKMYYEGSIGNLTYYRLWGKYHRRRKSSLTTKRFRKDKAFKGSRESAERFAAGNKLASRLYRMVDIEKKAYRLFCFLKKSAIELIKKGKTVDEAKQVLLDYLAAEGMIKEAHMMKPVRTETVTSGVDKELKFESGERVDAITDHPAHAEIETKDSLNIVLQKAQIDERNLIDTSTVRLIDTGQCYQSKFIRCQADSRDRQLALLRLLPVRGSPANRQLRILISKPVNHTYRSSFDSGLREELELFTEMVV